MGKLNPALQIKAVFVGIFDWRWFSVVAVLFVSVIVRASSDPGITYHGRILRPDGAPLQGQHFDFRMQIRSSAEIHLNT